MKKRVLIVEDDPWQADVFMRQLDSTYDIDIVVNGHAAIDAIDEIIPDVIMLDVLLAGATGFALIHELKSHDDLANIPIILVTNLAEVISVDVAKRYGISAVIDKSQLQPREIRSVIDRVIK
jgi:PleD family two-component response regulator